MTLNDSSSSQYTADSRLPGELRDLHLPRPRGPGPARRVDRLRRRPGTTCSCRRYLTLFDPDGRVAADSEPQGVGNYGNVDVRSPAAGLWTGVVSGYPAGDGGYNGKVVWQAVTQNYTSFGPLLGVVAVAGAGPGEELHALRRRRRPRPATWPPRSCCSSSLGGVTSIPVVVRSLINVAAGGAFSGVLTGGNGRGALGHRRLLPVQRPAAAPRPCGRSSRCATTRAPGQHRRRLPGQPGRQRRRLRAELRPVRRAARHHRPDAHRDRAQSGRRPVDADRGVRRAGPGHRGGRPVHRERRLHAGGRRRPRRGAARRQHDAAAAGRPSRSR